jgi:hypothetical protein
MADVRDTMLWPATALVVTQVVHVLAPIDSDKPESESWLGLPVGGLLLLLSVVGLVGIVQSKSYGRPLAAWSGLAVALGFIAYHAVPWSSVISNPYLGEPVGPWAWLSVALAVGSGFWAAWEGWAELRRTTQRGVAATS